jgi:hypothetical protein
MNGIVQRPASANGHVQRVGDTLEVRWHPRLAAGQYSRRGRRASHRSTERNLFDALVLVVTLAVLAGFVYLQARRGGSL